MLRTTLVSFVAAVLLTGACAAQEQSSASTQRGQRLIQTWLKHHDHDEDGRIAKGEARNQLKRAFDRIDLNQDGFLNLDELKQLAGRLSAAAGGRETNKAARFRVPDNVELQVDIAYRKGNEKWRLDLAMPKQRGTSPRAAIVFIHGGAWRSGDKGRGQWRSLPLQYAERGYVCVSLNYRLTGEAPFPACVEDCKCAVRWLRAHAEKYNVDPDRIGGYGNSAGAHLVAMLGLAGGDAELDGDGPHQDQTSMLQAVCCSATPADFTDWKTQNRTGNTALRDLFGGPSRTPESRLAAASPVTYAGEDAPPFLVIHGTADKTVPIAQGDGLVEALKRAGAKDVTYLRFDGAGHGVFGQHAKETGPAMVEFFARTVGAAE